MNSLTNILPEISVVIIGLNVEKYLRQCINSVQASNYPKELMEIIYADSGSTDKSIEIANSFEEVRVLCLNTDTPNAAKGRNAGLSASKGSLIQFVDADSYLHHDWLFKAAVSMKNDIAAIAGVLTERDPHKNIYHRMAGVEWNLRNGEQGWTTTESNALVFGGNVMIRRDSIYAAGGYDERLRAGEDPDLSYRIRQLGYQILRLNRPMASHDINISSRRQFLRRARRSGYAYTMLVLKYWREPERFMLKRVIRVIGGVLTPFVVLFLGAILGYTIPAVVLALLIVFRLVFKTRNFSRILNQSWGFSLRYSLYLAWVIYPQFLGTMEALIEWFKDQLTTKKVLVHPTEGDQRFIAAQPSMDKISLQTGV